jgi:hypothetical protein
LLEIASDRSRVTSDAFASGEAARPSHAFDRKVRRTLAERVATAKVLCNPKFVAAALTSPTSSGSIAQVRLTWCANKMAALRLGTGGRTFRAARDHATGESNLTSAVAHRSRRLSIFGLTLLRGNHEN